MGIKAIDRHPSGRTSVDSVSDLWAVTPSDDEDMAYVSRALLVTVEGDFRLLMASGADVTVPLTEGWHPMRVSRVFLTGTTGECFAGD
ncbi:spike base protein, RCAP_Rcc01079 family [Burkholderia stagnalis]|uniref:Uncharacterized protein n=1 Tax=Burkholderia stagnalis TaxID=1503054 RepID=A0A108GFZ8_9BURK|nr:hypothetical protein [Burkholderia stagnalis]KVZ03392.1 hypothetical protein WT35_28275 [Burkholderia stagnalis]KWA48400.1 hypothetical protein WT43_32590 [Burkholderia stagnalis]KWA51727.1 hypothetical protein WT42_16750 [Burkholderia stagnalis]KWA62708.1 hypothetical protein WT44_13850 [Burkholderia stagnalis]KWC98347.1 hypothetical protein WT46_23835 [Burkholderia stagnalis]